MQSLQALQDDLRVSWPPASVPPLIWQKHNADLLLYYIRDRHALKIIESLTLEKTPKVI